MTQDNQENNNTKRDNFKNALCYVPFVAIWLFFTEKNKSEELTKNIKYWISLLIAFVLIRFIIEWILMIPLGWLLFIIYIWVSAVFWYKANKWEKIDIEYIDKIEEKIKNNLK